MARAIYTEVKDGRGSARRRLPGHQLPAVGAGRRKLPSHVRAVQGACRRGHHGRADGGRADHALHDGRHPRRRGHGRHDHCPASMPRARWRPGLHGANRLGGNSLSDLLVFGRRAGERGRRGHGCEHGWVPAPLATPADLPPRSWPSRWLPWRRRSSAAVRIPTPPRRPAGDDVRRWSASSAPRRTWPRPSGVARATGALGGRGRDRPAALTIRAGTSSSNYATC